MFSLTLRQVLPAFGLPRPSPIPATPPAARLTSPTARRTVRRIEGALQRAARAKGERAGDPGHLSGGDPDNVIREVLRLADEQLQPVRAEPASWRPVVAQNVFGATSYLGIPATILAEQLLQPLFLNRGTENDLMVLGPSHHRLRSSAAGGSGFIAPDGTRSSHYPDQLASTRVPLSPHSVARPERSRPTLSPSPCLARCFHR